MNYFLWNGYFKNQKSLLTSWIKESKGDLIPMVGDDSLVGIENLGREWLDPSLSDIHLYTLHYSHHYITLITTIIVIPALINWKKVFLILSSTIFNKFMANDLSCVYNSSSDPLPPQDFDGKGPLYYAQGTTSTKGDARPNGETVGNLQCVYRLHVQGNSRL